MVTWNHLPDNKANGLLQGYTVYYTITRNGTTTLTQNITSSTTTTFYSNSLILSGFAPYTDVVIAVSAFTLVGEGPTSPSVIVGKLACFFFTPRVMYEQYSEWCAYGGGCAILFQLQ